MVITICHFAMQVYESCGGDSPAIFSLIGAAGWQSSFAFRRVHISDKTLAFLNGEFEVEPAFGEKREELLRIAGLKTYFITKVVKPVSGDVSNLIGETCVLINQGLNFQSMTNSKKILP